MTFQFPESSARIFALSELAENNTSSLHVFGPGDIDLIPFGYRVEVTFRLISDEDLIPLNEAEIMMPERV